MSFSLGNRVDIDALKREKKPEEEQIWEKKICLILGLGCLFFKKVSCFLFPDNDK